MRRDEIVAQVAGPCIIFWYLIAEIIAAILVHGHFNGTAPNPAYRQQRFAAGADQTLMVAMAPESGQLTKKNGA